MYKHSRQELETWFKINIGFDSYAEKEFRKMLLAQKEDRKECKHKFVETYTGGKRCNKCNMSLTEFKYSTPSPLEIEEIPEIKRMIVYPDICEDLAKVVKEIVENQNILISNQKKLYQYIKEKKI